MKITNYFIWFYSIPANCAENIGIPLRFSVKNRREWNMRGGFLTTSGKMRVSKKHSPSLDKKTGIEADSNMSTLLYNLM